MSKCKVVAVAHEKGGVAKSTTTLNLGVSLACDEKQRVLLVDVDPQGDLSKMMGYKDLGMFKYNLAKALQNEFLEQPYDLAPYIQHHTEGVDVIVSNPLLTGIEKTIAGAMEPYYYLKQITDKLKDNYDYMFLDCCPTVSMLVINALAAADSVLIPNQAHEMATEDLQNMFQTITRMRGRINPALQVEGVLMTMAIANTNVARKSVAQVNKIYSQAVHIFKTVVPYATKAAEAPGSGKSIFSYDPKGTVAQAYREFAKEVIDNGRAREKNNLAR